MWPLTFISEQDFHAHVEATIKQYGEKLEPYDLKKFNKNIVDPVKLIFDKTVYGMTWDEVIRNEIFRQRDKSNNNDIGYFHQRIFHYIENCEVPDKGWDVIFKNDAGINLPDKVAVSTVYAEVKNKHNTMNLSASRDTYIKMREQTQDDDDCACLLVEVIAKKSQNIIWKKTINKEKKSNRYIRRVSIDQFYALVTGQEDAFYQMCMVLPEVIEKVVDGAAATAVPHDTVIDELNAMAKSKDGVFALALYMLGFGSYKGF